MTGLIDVGRDIYHADQVGDVPTLSASIAHELISKSPAHAFAKHPRLSPGVQREEKKSFELGTAVHEVLLEGVDNVTVIVGFADWKKKDAQEQRDEARRYGRIPMLEHEHERVVAMCDSVRSELAVRDLARPFFENGTPEATLAWTEPCGVACRARLDWLHNDYLMVDDVKSTASSADPGFFARKTIPTYGYDLKAAFYRRGVRAVFGTEPEWRWLVVESTPPFALSVVVPDADVLAVGDAKVERALEMWRDCLASGVWPAYTRDVVKVSPPPWELHWVTDQLEQEAWEAFAV